MATGGRQNGAAVTLEQLAALNDEMAALVRAGVPLERGLGALGGELPGRSGELAALLASRMDRGESLSRILADDDERFPPLWRAVVEAGLRSGHLAAALESLSSTARRRAELRKLVGAGILYPLIVVALAYALFVCLVFWLTPLTLAAHEDLTGRSDAVMAGLDWLGRRAQWWAIPLPLGAAVVLGAWWCRSGRAPSSHDGAARPLDWLRPGRGIRQALRNGRMATFAEVLALLVKQQVPMHDSVVLAAEASGDRALAKASRQIAERLRRGEVLKRREDLPAGFPPMLGWLLMTGSRQPDLGEALARSALIYRQRAARVAEKTAVYLPISLTVFVGGTATLLCALTVFVPIARLFYHLAWP